MRQRTKDSSIVLINKVQSVLMYQYLGDDP